MSRSTPWGQSQGCEKLKNGITFHSTASHGGYYVPDRLVTLMPLPLRKLGMIHPGTLGLWFEEDCACCAVGVAFPGEFSQEVKEAAIRTLREYYPNAYEEYYNVKLLPGESRVRDEETFYAAHREDWLVSSASLSDTHEGMLECWARQGGQPCWASERRTAETLRREEKQFLVPRDEYNQRRNFPFVIDLSRHKEMAKP